MAFMDVNGVPRAYDVQAPAALRCWITRWAREWESWGNPRDTAAQGKTPR